MSNTLSTLASNNSTLQGLQYRHKNKSHTITNSNQPSIFCCLTRARKKPPNFFEMSGEETSKLLQSINFLPKEVAQLTSSGIQPMRNDLHSKGFTTIQVTPEITDFMLDAFKHAKHEQRNKFDATLNVSLPSDSALVNNLQNMAQKLFDVQLSFFQAQYRANPSAESWHQDKFLSHVIVCLTLGDLQDNTKKIGTEYLSPDNVTKFLNVEKTSHQRTDINVKEGVDEANIEQATQTIPANTISIFRGVETPNHPGVSQFYKDTPVLVHKTPANEPNRVILLLRFKIENPEQQT